MSLPVLRAIRATWSRVFSIVADASMPRTLRGRPWVALVQGREAGDHAGMGGTGHRADDDRVEEDAQLLLLLRDLEGPVGEAESSQRVLGRTGRDAVGDASGFLDLTQRFLPGAADTDVEAGRVEAHVSAHDA